jgi:hypothetical protein
MNAISEPTDFSYDYFRFKFCEGIALKSRINRLKIIRTFFVTPVKRLRMTNHRYFLEVTCCYDRNRFRKKTKPLRKYKELPALVIKLIHRG